MKKATNMAHKEFMVWIKDRDKKLQTKLKKIEETAKKKLIKSDNETFCIKKCQFVHKGAYCFWGKECKSRIQVDTSYWKLFEETKDAYWFRKKGGKK